MHTKNAALACALGIAGTVSAQSWEPNGAVMRFEVWSGTAWASSVAATPGSTVEWRVVFNYTGTRTDLFALGSGQFQPTISGVDNSGPIVDEMGAWRNGGVTGNGLAGTILTASEGASGSPNPNGYGRVVYGLQGSNTTFQNVHTTFRHSGGAGGAPAGDWIRLAGSFVTQWPRALAGPVPPLDVTSDDVNRILRGITIEQQSQALLPQYHVVGVNNLVVFRQSVTISLDGGLRDLQISSFQESLRRYGAVTGATEGDDRRYITWQTGPSDNGNGALGVRTGVVMQPAVIHVVPAPATLCGVILLFARSRRR